MYYLEVLFVTEVAVMVNNRFGCDKSPMIRKQICKFWGCVLIVEQWVLLKIRQFHKCNRSSISVVYITAWYIMITS